MKVIDLLNKIANGEEVPKKIKYNNIIYNWDVDGYLHYEDEHHSERAFLEGYRTDMCLNDEVEIIEEDKKIDHIYHCCMEPSSKETKFLIQNINDLADKINEIIEHINKENK